MVVRTIIIVLLITGIIKNLVNRLEIFFNSSDINELEFLLHQTKGYVGKENFTYYSLFEEGNIRILLDTSFGDADLYVSSIKKPQFEPDSYDFSSITCGKDIIDLPEDMKRPVIVGVYGHPSYEHSTFTLSMFINLEEAVPEKKDNGRGLGIKEKLNFIVRYTTMWRIFELIEGVLFML